MIYRCKACKYEESRGCLPSASCGLYMLGLMGLWIFGANLALKILQRHMPVGQVPELSSPPWWMWIVLIPAGLAFAVFGVLVLNSLFSAIEWLLFARRRCPQCGDRRWSWGFTRGFGL